MHSDLMSQMGQQTLHDCRAMAAVSPKADATLVSHKKSRSRAISRCLLQTRPHQSVRPEEWYESRRGDADGWFGHELADAILQSALGYHIRLPTISRPDAFIPN
jgi:hypothetical protein